MFYLTASPDLPENCPIMRDCILNFRLCGDRGIPALHHLCDDIKFKGKGHEVTKCQIVTRSELSWRKPSKNLHEIQRPANDPSR